MTDGRKKKEENLSIGLKKDVVVTSKHFLLLHLFRIILEKQIVPASKNV